MAVPLPLAIPAAAAGLAYLNAKTSFWYDMLMTTSVIPSALRLFLAKYRDRANLFYCLEDNALAAASANHPFILFEDQTYTYADVYDKALRYGHWWREKKGVQRGDIVALDYMNTDQFIFLWLGLWAVGAKPAFINYNLRDHALTHCVKTAGTKLMVVDPAVADAVTDDLRAGLPGVNIEVFSPLLEAEAAGMSPHRYPDTLRHEDKPENMAILIFTSGTTGLPKAAVVAWAKMIVSGNFTARWMGLTKNDVYYTCMPLYHSSACLLCFNAVLVSGTTIAVGRRFTNKTFWPDVRKHKATIIQYVGETCRYLLVAPPQKDPVTHEDLDRKHHVRMALGNGLRPDVWNRFKERFGIEAIAEFYGATEGTLATFNLSRNDYSVGAVGRSGWLYDVLMGLNVGYVVMDWETEAPYRDPKTGLCRQSKRGEPGELIFRLPADDVNSRFQGYYGNDKATESKIMRNVFKKGDAWFRTGDVMNHTSEGLTYFCDRIGDTFRWKSENVSTTEVAQVVGLHPEVVEANVYGIALPNHDGRAGCAAIVLNDDTASPAFLKSLYSHVQSELPKYAQPLFIRIIKDPSAHTTGTNKQQKHVLREQGANPAKTGKDEILWLKGGGYKPFSRDDWTTIENGEVRL